MTSTDEHVTALRERGFTLFPGIYPADYLELCAREMDRIRQDAGEPPLASMTTTHLSKNDLAISSVGLNFRKLLMHAPALVDGFLPPAVLAVLHGALGGSVRVEATGGTMSDASRGFHCWHYHVGGLDEDLPSSFQRDTLEPTVIRRITMLLYVDPIGPDTGSFLVYPRKLDDPIDCPFPDAMREEWAGQLVVGCPPGTALLTEERTWHASLPRKGPGLRRFLAAWFLSDTAAPTTGVDDSVPQFEDALLHRRQHPEHAASATERA